jgi:hypothetical protein
MFRSFCLVGAYALLGAVVLAGVTYAADKHHSGQDKLGDRIKKDGKHEIHKTDNHVVHAHVKGKKVTGVTATHKTTGKMAKVTKYRSKKKLHAMADSPRGETHFVMAETETVELLTVWVGFGFSDGVHLYIFWFPLELVDGGDDGAVDYDSGI